jgi:hypothetical protein
MALLNFSLPFGSTPNSWATVSPIHASPHAVNNLYEPLGHHQENVLHNDDYYKNGPYRHHQPPSQQQQQQQQQNNNRNYLPPHHTNSNNNRNGFAPQQQTARTRTYGESSYSQQPQQPSGFGVQSGKNNAFNTYQQKTAQPQTTKAAPATSYQSNNKSNNKNFNQNQAAGFPERPPGFKQIQSGQGTRTQNGECCLIKYFDLTSHLDDFLCSKILLKIHFSFLYNSTLEHEKLSYIFLQ